MRKVSVVIPAYNKANLTVKVVESVLNQTYKNIEIIVVDDGSTDNTRQLLAAYGDKIKYVYKENGGACSARNVGIELAQGEYIGLLDCDDEYLPKKIELSVEFLEKHLDFGLVYSAAQFIDDKGNILGNFSHSKSRRPGWIAKELLLRDYICNSTVVVHKGCFRKVGDFDETIFTPGDWDMWLRLAEQYKIGYIDLPLVLYRASGSYILEHIEQMKKEELLVLKKTFLRNSKTSFSLRNKAISNVYYRCALSYLIRGNFKAAREDIKLSLFYNKFKAKSIFLLGSSLLAPKTLQNLVKKRIAYNFGL